MTQEKYSILIGNGFNLALNNTLNESNQIKFDYNAIMGTILSNKDKSMHPIMTECKNNEITDIEEILNLLGQIPTIIKTFKKSLFNS